MTSDGTPETTSTVLAPELERGRRIAVGLLFLAALACLGWAWYALQRPLYPETLQTTATGQEVRVECGRVQDQKVLEGVTSEGEDVELVGDPGAEGMPAGTVDSESVYSLCVEARRVAVGSAVQRGFLAVLLAAGAAFGHQSLVRHRIGRLEAQVAELSAVARG